MTEIIKYEVINPISDKTRPFYKDGVLYIPIHERYKFIVETRQIDEYGYTTYYLLLSKTKFSQHCRPCQTDGYGRVKFRPKGEMKDFIVTTCKKEGNINIEYIESGDEYDVFMLS